MPYRHLVAPPALVVSTPRLTAAQLGGGWNYTLKSLVETSVDALGSLSRDRGADVLGKDVGAWGAGALVRSIQVVEHSPEGSHDLRGFGPFARSHGICDSTTQWVDALDAAGALSHAPINPSPDTRTRWDIPALSAPRRGTRVTDTTAIAMTMDERGWHQGHTAWVRTDSVAAALGQ